MVLKTSALNILNRWGLRKEGRKFQEALSSPLEVHKQRDAEKTQLRLVVDGRKIVILVTPNQLKTHLA